MIALAEAEVYSRRNRDGHYTWGGVKLPSVTTVLGLIGSDHLYMWYSKMVAEEVAQLVTRRAEGFLDPEECDEALLDWKSRMTAAVRYRDHKAAIGSITHHAIYERAMGISPGHDAIENLMRIGIEIGVIDPNKDTDPADPYGQRLAREARHYVESAYRWLDDEVPDFEAIGQEAVCVSLTHSYAGTTDAIVNRTRKSNRRLHLDFKTSNSIDEKKFRMQIEAYRRADFIGLMADGSEHEVPPTDGVGIVWVRPMDKTTIHEFDVSDELFEGFLSARHLYGVLHEMPKANHRPRAARADRPAAAARTEKARQPKECPF